MKKDLNTAYMIAVPLGFLGLQQLYLGNIKGFIVRILACLTFIGGLLFWAYDLINLSKMVDECNKKHEGQINYIINLLDQGKLKEALKHFIKTGHTQVYVQEIIRRGKGDVIVKHFAKTDEDKKKLEGLIKNGDTESLVVHLTTFYASSKLTEMFA